MYKALILLVCVLAANAYESDGNLLKLTDADFASALGEFPNLFVKFFAPWCGHCKKLAPTYIEVADSLKASDSTVRLAEVDCTVQKETCKKYGIKGFPTLNYFSKGSDKPEKYTGGRSKDVLVTWLNEKSGAPVKVEEPVKQEAAVEAVPEDESAYKVTDGLYALTDANFRKALDDYDFVMVKFYAPWCGHCKKLAPDYAALAKENKNEKVMIADVDCTVHKTTCGQNGVKGYPTLKFFARGNEPLPYKGARTKDALNSFIEQNVAKLIPQVVPDPIPEPPVEEL